jgi:hypothetical protein
MECSSGKSNFDFWTALVDYRDTTDKITAPIRNSSFISFKDNENSEEILSNHGNMMVA